MSLPNIEREPIEGDENELAEYLRPNIEESIRLSVRRDPHILSDALYPAIGPSIRLAVFKSISDMVESLNQVLHRALSIRNIAWRWEAWRAGRPLAEIAYVRSLLFSVDQVLLVHRHTGLLIWQVERPASLARDPQLVSAMLTAIQDFVRDSFQLSAGAGVDAIRVGDLTVWIEQGPQAVLAAVVRGQPPSGLRTKLGGTLARIHREFARDLLEFQGMPGRLARSEELLGECLTVELQPATPESHRVAYIFLACCAVALATIIGFNIQSKMTWNRFVAFYRNQAGVVILEADQGTGGGVIAGLLDPSVPLTPSPLASRFPRVAFRWKHYLSLEPDVLLARAKAVLSPPEGVRLHIDGDVLDVDGSAPASWIEAHTAASIAGIRLVRMQAKPDAASLIARIGAQHIAFVRGSSLLTPEARQAVDRVAKIIGEFAGSSIRIRIVGHADGVGSASRNLTLSRERAEAVRAALIAHSVAPSRLEAVGQGADLAGRAVSFEPASASH